jgi:hypothetical protein
LVHTSPTHDKKPKLTAAQQPHLANHDGVTHTNCLLPLLVLLAHMSLTHKITNAERPHLAVLSADHDGVTQTQRAAAAAAAAAAGHIRH